MATGTGNLPNPGMAFTPFDILTAAELNDISENVDALATGTGLGDGSVPNSALKTGTGEPGGAWTSFTPVYTNLTVGNGTNNGRQKLIGKTMFFETELTWGSGTSATGTGVLMNFPSTAVTYIQYHRLGLSQVMNAAGGVIYNGSVAWNTTGNMIILNDLVSGTTVRSQAVSNTAPITMTTGAIIITHGFYEIA